MPDRMEFFQIANSEVIAPKIAATDRKDGHTPLGQYGSKLPFCPTIFRLDEMH